MARAPAEHFQVAAYVHVALAIDPLFPGKGWPEKNIPVWVDQRLDDIDSAPFTDSGANITISTAISQLGTLGGGNHFIEAGPGCDG